MSLYLKTLDPNDFKDIFFQPSKDRPSTFIKILVKTRKGINIIQILQELNKILITKQNMDVKILCKMLVELSSNL